MTVDMVDMLDIMIQHVDIVDMLDIMIQLFCI